MRFLFPSDYFKPQQVDAAYAEEFVHLQNLGFQASVISLEALDSGFAKIFPTPARDSKLIYRGWMLSAEYYLRLVDIVRNTGADMWIDRDEYLSAHYLPNWYPLISDLTPETHLFSIDDNLEKELNNLGWSEFFIKDYVKSLKTSIGSIIDNPTAISQVVAEMQKFRGTIEGGICVRKVEDFLPETERRYFAIDGCIFAANLDEKIPTIVEECACRIESNFFSMDAIERSDGCHRIVEIGDGQVSGLSGWTVDRFTKLWLER